MLFSEFKLIIFHFICDHRAYCGITENGVLLMHTLEGESSSVCVEVLQPSQPNGVMSSAVSLPNHTFTGQD